jgi:hypothetical protein
MRMGNLTVSLITMVLLCSCEKDQRPSSLTAPLPPPTGHPNSPALVGAWGGTMTDWVGTAQATLTVPEEGVASVAYQYPSPGERFNVVEGGMATIVTSPEAVVTMNFSSPREHEGSCWVGTFEGSLRLTSICRRELSGTYSLQGGTDSCFSPPRGGTFNFVSETCD